MTRTIPRRRTTLHRSHTRLTELRTFIGVFSYLIGKERLDYYRPPPHVEEKSKKINKYFFSILFGMPFSKSVRHEGSKNP